MERILGFPREDWERKVEKRGFPIHSLNGPYWDESIHYTFTRSEVDTLEAATNELQKICLHAVDHVISHGRYREFHIPELAIPLIEESWNACNGDGAPALYGRMDLFFDGSGPAKLLEYNADTPTALIEAAVLQWDWKEDLFPARDQFNSIHDRLVQGWKDLSPYLKTGPVHFASLDNPEDVLTATYLQDTAAQAGLRTKYLKMEDIGYRAKDQRFVDLESQPIANLFKLYPWEWLCHEEFGPHIGRSGAYFLEPAWKMILSNKQILALLWELNPGHPNLLPCYNEVGTLTSYAKKPLLSREGANVTLVEDGKVLETGSNEGYGSEGFVYQELVTTKHFDGCTPVLGSWLIQGEAAGIGIREASGRITNNTSRFVPHCMT